mgnify:CR=1 FL=1
MRALFKFLVFMAAWLVWSGVPDWNPGHVPLTVVFGVFSSALVVFFSERMRHPEDASSVAMTFWVRHITYLPWLVKEIVMSNLHVARVILSPTMPIRPRVLRVQCTQTSDMAKVVYANSITLTPGTITLDLRGDSLLVHALTADSAEGLLTGEMDRRVTEMEA